MTKGAGVGQVDARFRLGASLVEGALAQGYLRRQMVTAQVHLHVARARAVSARLVEPLPCLRRLIWQAQEPQQRVAQRWVAGPVKAKAGVTVGLGLAGGTGPVPRGAFQLRFLDAGEGV